MHFARLVKTLLCLAFIIHCLMSTCQAVDDDSASDDSSGVPHRTLCNTMGIPSSFVNGSVNVISGDLVESETDIVVSGPEPVSYGRYYCSSDKDKWFFGHGMYMKVLARENVGISAEISDSSGGSLKYSYEHYFRKNEKNTVLRLAPELINKGLTNTGEGTISGRNNPKTTKVNIAFFGDDDYSVELGSGEVHKYQVTSDRWHSKKRNREAEGRLSKEIKPNGNRVEYTFHDSRSKNRKKLEFNEEVDRERLLKIHTNGRGLYEIKSTNSTGNTCYASLSFNKSFNHTDVVEASDGRKINYIFDKPTRLNGGSVITEKLESVSRSDARTINYKYDNKSFTKELPDGRQQITEYYVYGENDVGGTKVTNTRFIGRVRLQKAPVGTTSTPLITHRFFYTIIDIKDPDDGKMHISGRTDVYNALGHMTRYDYRDDQRLNSIQFYDQNGALHSSQHMTWGANNTPDAGNLISYSFADQNNNIIHYTTHKYDDRGNVTERMFHGNQTGNGGGESYPHHFVYSNDGFNLLLQESEGSGKSTYYGYLPNTNLAYVKLVCDNDKIVYREFYDYDSNAVQIRKIIDDGSTNIRDNLTGVTSRQIVEITPKQQAPCLGLPEVIATYAVDLSSGANILLKKAVMDYSSEGYVLKHEIYDANDALTQRTECVYDAMGNAILEKNILGHVIQRQFDANGNKISESGPAPGSLKTYAYDFSDRLISESVACDGKKLTKKYRYDLCGRMINSTDYFGHHTLYVYDAFGNCTKKILPSVVDGAGNRSNPVMTQTYDCMGNLTSVTDANGYTTTTQYNVLGQPIHISYPDGTREEFRYVHDGQLAKHVAKNGTTTIYTRDSLGRVLKEEVFDKEVLLSSKQNIYTGCQLTASIDPEGNATHYEYDFAGRICSTIKGTSVTRFEYDASGRQTRVIQGSGESTVVAVQEYDLLHRVIEERIEDAHGNIQKLSQYVYDEAGNRIMQISESQAGTAVSSIEYNLLNKPTKMVDALGNVIIIIYDYNAINCWGEKILKTTVIDPLGQQMITEEDSLGRIVSVKKIDPMGNLIAQNESVYDIAGNRVQSIDTVFTPGQDDKKLVTAFSYGPLNHLTAVVEAFGDPNQKTTTYSYDNFGNKSGVAKPDGVTLNFTYDALGRLSDYSASDESVAYTYVYDRNSNLLEVVDRVTNSTTKRTYDDQGRIVSETLANGLTIEQHYDQVGRAFEIVLPDQSLIRHGFEGSLLRSVARYSAEGEEKYAHHYLDYDLAGHLLAANSVGSGRIEMEYDLAGRLKKYSAPHYSFEVDEDGYDAVNNLRNYSITDREGEIPCRFSYDTLYQLKSEAGVAQHTYEHDSVHNRVKKDGIETVINALNQLLSDGIRDYHYDFNGNLIEREEGGRPVKYSYDALDRLIEVQTAEKRVSYTYDSFNRRLTKKVCESSGDCILDQKFIYDGQNEIGSTDSSGTIVELRVLGAGRGAEIGAAIAIELQDKLYVPIHNERGDVAVLMDPGTGEAVEWYRYTAFGEETIFGVGQINPWRFASKRVDADTGFVAFGRRDYDPVIGRWVTPDPAGYVDGPNLYAYVLNNPLTQFDLYGLHIDYNRENAHLTASKYEKFDSTKVGEGGRSNRKSGEATRWEESKQQREKAKFKDGEIKQDVAKYTKDLSAKERKRSRNIAINAGNAVPGRAIVYMNGICTSLDEAIAVALELSSMHGNCEVTLCYNATHGVLGDLAESFISILGIETQASRNAAQAMIGACEQVGANGTVDVFGFSQGVITADVALGRLSDPERKKIEVIGLGGGTTISSKHGVNATHYISTGDSVSQFLNFFARFRDSNVVLLPAVNKWNDHSFFGSAYQPLLDDRGGKFVAKHGAFSKT